MLWIKGIDKYPKFETNSNWFLALFFKSNYFAKTSAFWKFEPGYTSEKLQPTYANKNQFEISVNFAYYRLSSTLAFLINFGLTTAPKLQITLPSSNRTFSKEKKSCAESYDTFRKLYSNLERLNVSSLHLPLQKSLFTNHCRISKGFQSNPWLKFDFQHLLPPH